MNNDGKVLFNEKCSICNFEIKHYKKRSELDFTDCSHMEDKYLKKLHVTFDDGTELVELMHLFMCGIELKAIVGLVHSLHFLL